MNPYLFLTGGYIPKLELLATNVGAVLWIASPNYEKSLFVSSTYEKIWQKNIITLYSDLKSWKNHIISDDIDNTYYRIIQRNTQINPSHTELFGINKNSSIQWILDRSFNLNTSNNETLLIAGAALPIPESALAGKDNEEMSNKLDKIILEFYQILLQLVEKSEIHTELKSKIAHLSKKEMETLKFILSGLSAKEISKKMNISYRTAEAHTNAIKEKLGCGSKSEIIIKIIEMQGWNYFDLICQLF